MYRLFPLFLVVFYACGGAAQQPATGGEAAPLTSPVYQDVSPEEFAELIGQDNTILLDVRTPAETAKGIIEGAIEMDYRAPNFTEQLKSLDPQQTYLVYCASGGRSGKTAELLNGLGAKKVYNLKGGYRAWTQ